MECMRGMDTWGYVSSMGKGCHVKRMYERKFLVDAENVWGKGDYNKKSGAENRLNNASKIMECNYNITHICPFSYI
jgi:hypothetical protein